MLQDKIKEAEKSEYASQGTGDWYKFKEGDNTLRVLTEPETIYEDYQNGICFTECGFKGSPKGLAYILDARDNKIKPFKLPWKLVKQLSVWETDEEYSFKEYPMPYNIKVNAIGAGTKEVEYTFMAGRVNSEVSADILADLSKKMPVADIVSAMKEKNKKKHCGIQKQEEKALPTVEYPNAEDEEISPENIPF